MVHSEFGFRRTREGFAGFETPEEQLLAAETVLRRAATVRSTERLVARLLGVGSRTTKSRRRAAESPEPRRQ